jgi:hypothetical protein
MMDLRDALNQIAAIRQQVARTGEFRGYRALPVAFSGLLAFAAAGVQLIALPEPSDAPFAFFALWIGTAALSVAATGWEMLARLRRSVSPLEREKLIVAVTQFCPCLLAGAVLMLVIARFSPENLWMLPGLWAMFFGLGMFASWRLVAHGVAWVGAYYLAAGALSLILARGDAAFSPWVMAVPFGVGQLLTAAVLYRSVEGTDEQAEEGA